MLEKLRAIFRIERKLVMRTCPVCYRVFFGKPEVSGEWCKDCQESIPSFTVRGQEPPIKCDMCGFSPSGIIRDGGSISDLYVGWAVYCGKYHCPACVVRYGLSRVFGEAEKDRG